MEAKITLMWRRDFEGSGAELATTGKDHPGQETMERSCASPMLQEEPTAQIRPHSHWVRFCSGF